MTAYALHTPVIATRVGAFPEHIEENITGMLVPVNDPDKLAEKMIAALENNFYKIMENNLIKNQETTSWASSNKTTLLHAYS